MKKPRRLVRTPTPIDGIPNAVYIVTRVAQYTEIVLAYVESARAATESALSYSESAQAYSIVSDRAAAASARAAVEAARTTQVEITKMMEGEDSS